MNFPGRLPDDEQSLIDTFSTARRRRPFPGTAVGAIRLPDLVEGLVALLVEKRGSQTGHPIQST